jgi:hypothetical protein
LFTACNLAPDLHDASWQPEMQPPGTPVPPSSTRAAPATTFDPFANGWVEATSATIGGASWFRQMTATWTVPAVPAGIYTSSPSKHFAVWPGLEPTTNNIVIQPVLFYGFGPGDSGGTRWSLACYVTDRFHNYTNSTLITVNPGDSLTTSLDASNCTASGVCTWTCTATDVSTGQSTSLTQSIGEVLSLAFGGVVEVLGLDLGTCFDYPANGPSVISNIVLYDQTLTPVAPSWSNALYLPNTSCGFGVGSTSDSATLAYTGWVCTPGGSQTCCGYPQGCSCAGERFCSASGSWSACFGSSPTGRPCR